MNAMGVSIFNEQAIKRRKFISNVCSLKGEILPNYRRMKIHCSQKTILLVLVMIMQFVNFLTLRK